MITNKWSVIGIKILDATCGFRGIWYQKNHPFVTFMDKRKGAYKANEPFNRKKKYKINPDVVSKWKDAPFPDDYFDMIIFDPPHQIWKKERKESTMAKCYGHLYEDNWKQEIKEGVEHLFKILKPEGIFILKWTEECKSVEEVLKLFPYKPLFGSNTKSKNYTANFWIVFIKYRLEKDLIEFEGEQSPLNHAPDKVRGESSDERGQATGYQGGESAGL